MVTACKQNPNDQRITFVRSCGTPTIVGLLRRSDYDLCGISMTKKQPAAGPRAARGVVEVGEGDPHRLLPARQSQCRTLRNVVCRKRQRGAAASPPDLIGWVTPTSCLTVAPRSYRLVDTDAYLDAC